MSAAPCPGVVYIGAAGNELSVQLTTDGQPINDTTAPGWMAGITRVVLTLGDSGTVVDSDVDTTAFDWVTEAASGIIIMVLGNVLTAEWSGNTKLEIYHGSSITVMAHDSPLLCVAPLPMVVIA